VCDILSEYLLLAALQGCDKLHCTATSAARDAENGQELVAACAALGPVELQILSGDEEALLSFRGALSGAPELQGATVVDIGGGSTELVWGSRQAIESHRSLDVGSVRFTERLLDGAPPSARAKAALVHEVRAQLASLPVRALPRAPLIGVAGTITSLAACALELERFDARRVDGAVLSRAEVGAWCERLGDMTSAEILALGSEFLAGREDVFFAGVTILHEIMQFLGVSEVRVSERGLRYGWAERIAARGPAQ
jgi:exopolyphosphatase/guanosine-5'-triphosphate,3'-diphosphate pyrophosphatase